MLLLTGVSHVDMLNAIEGKHVLHALLAGFVAGVLAQLACQYLVNQAEVAVGLAPSQLF
jgi:hypothetical protein